MKSSSLSYWIAGLVLAGGTVVLLTPKDARAQGQGGGGGPPTRDVLVVNGPTEPVPVTGELVVAGVATIAGAVDASQAGKWSVGIDPTRNLVRLDPEATFLYDPGFSGMNDGVVVELGPFDTSGLSTLRLLARAVNGNVRFEVLVPSVSGGLQLDDFTLNGEDGNRYATFSYDAPPPSVSLRLTETGPGGSNFQVMLVGR